MTNLTNIHKRLTEIEELVIDNMRKNELFKQKILDILNSEEQQRIQKWQSSIEKKTNQ